MPKPTATPLRTVQGGFAAHVRKWGNGCGSSQCPPHNPATRVCHARGVLPCDVAFVGEAPGESENVLGRPFCGPAGHLMDEIVARVKRLVSMVPDATHPAGARPWTHAFMNVVGCIPREGGGTSKAGEPDAEQMECCGGRLEELLLLARPKLVATLGTCSRDWLRPGFVNPTRVLPKDTLYAALYHPAYILRAPVAQRGILIQHTVAALASTIDKVKGT